MLIFLDTLIGFAVVMLGVSLIIMILNQAIAALLAHRGSNLCWGLSTLFGNIAPGVSQLPVLTAFAPWLAETVVTHPLISDSLFSTRWAEAVKNHPALLRIVRRWQFANAIQPSELTAILNHIVSNRPPDLPRGLHRILSAEIRAALAAGNLDQWFGRIENRISQRFTLWMRIWTAIFGLLISFVACLDAFSLASGLYSQGDIRGQLVGAAPQISTIAGRIIPQNAKTSEDAVKISVTELYTTALNKAVADAGTTGIPPASDIGDLQAAQTWIQKNVAEDKRVAISNALDKNLAVAQKEHLQDAAQVISLLSSKKIEGIGWASWHWSDFPGPTFLRRFAGVIASWLLLCLGAPFWFNALSSLTSLRPAVAEKK